MPLVFGECVELVERLGVHIDDTGCAEIRCLALFVVSPQQIDNPTPGTTDSDCRNSYTLCLVATDINNPTSVLLHAWSW